MQSLVSVPDTVARRMHRLVEPIHLVTYFCDEPTEALMALGLRNYWDGYFAGRAAPLGTVSAEVVHAVFYNFADGEAARHIPRVWGTTTPAGGARRPPAGQRRGAEAHTRRPRRRPRSRACRRPRHHGGDKRADGGTDPVRRAPGAPAPSRNPSPGSGTRPPCCASTAVTVISPPWSPRASGGRRPMCSTRSPRTCRPRSSEGSITSPPTGWPGWWTGCGTADSSTPPDGSATPAGRPRNGSSRSPMISPGRRTPDCSQASSTSSSRTSSPSRQRSTRPGPR